MPNPLHKQYGKHALAANQLIQSMGTVKTNAPINRREGDLAQAGLEERSAESMEGALKALASDTLTKIAKHGSKHTKRKTNS